MKVIEVVGISQSNFDDAISAMKASGNVHGIAGVEVPKFLANGRDSSLT